MKLLKKIIIIFGPLVGGIIVGFIAPATSYKGINKPPLSPPGLLFPIVWSILYLLMGISFYLALNKKYNKKSVFLVQLIVNYIWPILFFNFRLYTISAFWLIMLIGLVINMIIKFLETKKIAGILQFPYFIWLLFALYLNIGVAILN